jgi:MFS family permease
MAVYSVVMSVGFMAAFPAVGGLVQSLGWRGAWLAVGVSLLVLLTPLAWLLVRRSPEACGLATDGVPGTATPPEPRPVVAAPADGYEWRAALVTPAFWAFALGASLYGLIASGIGLFNEAILAERGFAPGMYYNTLVVTALTALGGNFLGGWLAARVALASLLASSMAILTAGLIALPQVAHAWQVYAWATSMGLGGGFVTVLFFTAWPRLFGRRALGRIQGTAQALTVIGSAVGPLLLAWCVERTGSYASAFYALAIPVAAIAAWSLVVATPRTPPALATP